MCRSHPLHNTRLVLLCSCFHSWYNLFKACNYLYWDANCKAITDFRERDLCKVRTMNMDQHHWWGWLGVKVISLSGCWLHKCLHVSYMSELSSNFFCYIVTISFTSLQATWCRFSVKPCMCQDLTCQMIVFLHAEIASPELWVLEWCPLVPKSSVQILPCMHPTYLLCI